MKEYMVRAPDSPDFHTVGRPTEKRSALRRGRCMWLRSDSDKNILGAGPVPDLLNVIGLVSIEDPVSLS